MLTSIQKADERTRRSTKAVDRDKISDQNTPNQVRYRKLQEPHLLNNHKENEPREEIDGRLYQEW